MKDLEKFSKDVAISYSNTVKERMNTNVDNVANKIIDYISSRYEGVIKSAIDNNFNCKSVKISLPRSCSPKKLSSNEGTIKDILRELNETVSAHFKNFGFAVFLTDGGSCRCLFDCLCNRKEFVAEIIWE
jgi:hypothetical protein